MKQFVFVFGIRLIVFAVLSASFSACGRKPKRPGGSSAFASGANGEPFPVQASLTAFEEQIYKPYYESNNCAGCHEVHKVKEESHAYTVGSLLTGDSNDAGLIFFQAPEFSELYTRVLQKHNCGSDDCTAEKVLAAINKWKAAIEATGYEIPLPSYPNTSEQSALSSAVDVNLSFNEQDVVAIAAGSGAGTGGFATPQTNDVDGKVKTYIGTAARANPFNQGAAGAASTVLSSQVNVAGDYYVWMRVKIASADANQMFVSASNNGNAVGAFGNVQRALDPTGDDTWAWRQLMDRDGEPLVASLTPGPFELSLQEETGGVNVNYVVLSSRPDANLEQFVTSYKDVSVDISSVAGSKAKIVARIWEQSQEEGQSKAVGVSHLRIESAKPLQVKGIRPLVNGIFIKSHATYLFVDTTAGGSELSDQIIDTGGTTATTFLADITKDLLSFSFEEIGPAK
jgi:hypothetical protein